MPTVRTTHRHHYPILLGPPSAIAAIASTAIAAIAAIDRPQHHHPLHYHQRHPRLSVLTFLSTSACRLKLAPDGGRGLSDLIVHDIDRVIELAARLALMRAGRSFCQPSGMMRW